MHGDRILGVRKGTQVKSNNKDVARKKLGLRRERLRQLDTSVLDQVAGGWYATCMGTWAAYAYTAKC